MKRNGYMVIATVGILLAILAIGFSVVSLAGQCSVTTDFDREKNGMTLNSKLVEYTLEPGEIQRVELEGLWKGSIELDSGLDSSRLVLRIPEKAVAENVWTVDNGTLHLKASEQDIGGEFVLSLPTLETLDLRFFGELEVSGKSEKDLLINAKAAGNIDARDLVLPRLTLKGELMGDVDLDDLEAVELVLDLQCLGTLSVGKVDTISGKISGMGNFDHESASNTSKLDTSGLLGNK